MPARTRARSERPGTESRSFPPETASIAATRRFVRECAGGVFSDPARLGDVELATSELVTNAVEHGDRVPVRVAVSTEPDCVVLSVTSARSTGEMAEPSNWAGPLPAVRTGRGLAIVRAVSDDVAVEADETSLTVICTFEATAPPV